jgi:hypothetical protein
MKFKYIVATALLLLTGAAVAHDLAICHGEFAFCGASATTPTGKTMVVNGQTYQQGVAVCPVLNGDSIANLKLMNGSCNPPKGKGTVWSLFAYKSSYPQAPTWEVLPALPRTFVTTSGTGGMSNMWSFPCVKEPQKVNGVTLAKCYGPLNESPWTGTAVPIGTTVVTDAPVGATYPVGGNLHE